jgi:hypothetical protein
MTAATSTPPHAFTQEKKQRADGPPESEARDTFDPDLKTIDVSLAGSHFSKDWKAQSPTWNEFCECLSKSPVGSKNGPCYSPGILKGTRRQLPFVEKIDLAVVDSDCGYTLEELRASVSAAGFAAIIHSTYSHQSTETLVAQEALDKKYGGDAEAALRAKGYLPRVLEGGVRVVGKTVKVETRKKNGKVVKVDVEYAVIQHAPCPKFRIIFLLLESWRAESHGDYKSLSKAQLATRVKAETAWRDFIHGLAVQLDLNSDQSCCDPTRLYYLPRSRRDGPPFEYLRLYGSEVDMGSVPGVGPAKQDRGEHGSDRGKASKKRRRWAAKCASRFEIVAALEARSPHVLGRLNGAKRVVECPFEDEFA